MSRMVNGHKVTAFAICQTDWSNWDIDAGILLWKDWLVWVTLADTHHTRPRWVKKEVSEQRIELGKGYTSFLCKISCLEHRTKQNSFTVLFPCRSLACPWFMKEKGFWETRLLHWILASQSLLQTPSSLQREHTFTERLSSATQELDPFLTPLTEWSF